MSDVTVWADTHGASIDAVLSMQELERLVREEPAAGTKAELRLLKLATFGDKRSPRRRDGSGGKALRWDGNVTSVTGVIGDYDGEQMPMAEGVERVRAAGIEAVFHTSASHEPEKPRWRVICPLAASIVNGDLRERHRYWTGVLNAVLGGVLKGESFVLSQSYYFGGVQGRPAPEVIALPGTRIDRITSPPDPVYPTTAANGAAPAGKQKDRSQSADLLKKVARADTGDEADDDALVEQFKSHTHAARQGDPERAVRRCIEKVRADRKAALVEMNGRHAVVSWKGKTIILTEKQDPNFNRMTFELSSIGDFNNWYANQFLGKQTRSQWWLRHRERRQYETVAFVPGREMPGAYNLWRGFGVRPRAGDCSLYLELIEEVICSGNKALTQYVIAWLADAVQNPAERPGVVLVLKGAQGIGKGTLAREFGALFGAHFLHLQHAAHLTGRFNAHLANTLLLFADECFWAGDKQHESALKALITEPTVPIEFKGKDIITVPNYVRIVMASNKDWVVPAALDDRRFAVIDVSDKRARDGDYFARIHAQMKAGGAAALLDHLLKVDLSEIELRKIPETAARTEQQLRSMDPAVAFWYARLNNGSQFETESAWAEEVVKGELYVEFAQEAKLSGENRRGHETAFGIQLRRMCPDVRTAEVDRTVMPEVKDDRSGNVKHPAVRRRMKVYRFPSLGDCRRAFEAFAARPFEWDAASGAVREKRDEM